MREDGVILVSAYELVEVFAQLVDIDCDPIVRTIDLMGIHPDQLHVVHELM
jgi:hypothetical protein